MAIWVLGLRNPYTFDVQPGAGRILINDVGRATYKEIDYGARGANYELPLREGRPENDPRFWGPLRYYAHGSSSTTGCAITGGAFYNSGNI